MEDSKRKGKEPETSAATFTISDDQTPPASPHRPPSPPPPPPHAAAQPPSSSTSPPPPLSSTSAGPALAQVDKRLKLSTPDHDVPTNQDASTSSPRIPLSSIPPAHCRPFFNLPSGCLPLPRPQKSQWSIWPTPAAASSSGYVFSFEKNIPKLWLMKPSDRAGFRRMHQGQIIGRKKHRRDAKSEARRNWVACTRPGPSPLGPGLTPYQKVQKCLAELKDFINNLANPDAATANAKSSSSCPVATTTTTTTDQYKAEVTIAPLPSLPLLDAAIEHAMCSSSGPIAPPPPASDIHGASSLSGVRVALALPGQGCSSSDMEVDTWGLTVEDVIDMLDEYMKGVPRTIGAQEMEDGLIDIQIRVGVDPRPTWYALMSKSYEDMWESLVDYFSCDALEKANLLEDVLEEDPSGSGASGAGPSSATPGS